MLDAARVPVIVAAVRTPLGRYGGQLSSVRPDDLAAHVVRSISERYPAAMEQLGDVIFGAANQAGEDNRNVGRMAALLAGLPTEIPGVTVNRLCGSGMEAVITACRAILVGDGDCYIAGGVESMTRSPFVMPKSDSAFPQNAEIFNTALGWRMVNPKMDALYPIETLGSTAENVAERYNVTREDQDRWALGSHEKAAKAQDQGWFDDEIVPIELPAKGKAGKGAAPIRIEQDEGVRRESSMEALGKLPPAFRKGGTVTAGNSSPLNDGAAAILVMSHELANKLQLEPLAMVRGWGHAGVHPSVMGIGPVPASRRALERCGLRPSDIDVAELNEAFAAQAVASMRSLGLDPERVNPSGGAIAIGHPLGCSGARIIATLAHGMRRRGARRGLASMCIGVGQGIATVLERPT